MGSSQFPENTPQGIPLSTFDAKGDLIVGSADNAIGRFAAGSDFTQLVSRAGATNGVEWGGRIIKFKPSNQSVSSTSFANDSDLQFPVVSGGCYAIEGYLYVFSAATTTGAKIAVNANQAATSLIFGAIGQITQGSSGAASTFFGNTAVAYNAATTLGASVVNTSSANPSVILLHGFYTPSADTTLILRIAGEAAASITYMAGSWMALTRIG